MLPEEGVPASIVIVDGNGQAGTIGAALAEPVIVRVLDVQGRPVQGQQVTFTVMIGGGSVAPSTPTTNADGEASTNWTLGPAAGMQQLQARATGGAAPPDLSVALNATAAASAATDIAAVSGGSQSATAGSTLPDSLIVVVTDAAGNPVAGIVVAWTLTGGGSVSEASTVTGADGRSGVRRTLGTAAGPQTTVATVAGLTGSPVTFAATATVGSAGRLSVRDQPSETAASGTAFARQPSVQMQDANGNDVAIPGRAITAALASGPAGSSLFGSPTVATSFDGLATFSGLGITGPAGEYTLNFTGANLTGATSGTITLTVGAATRLAFSAQPPTTTTAGALLTPPLRVTVQDALGQTVTGATNAITLAIGVNPGSGTLSGTTTVNAVNGVATFSGLSLNRVGAGYTLIATSPSLLAATSSAFNVTAGAPASIAVHSPVPGTTVAGSAVVPDPAVRVTDASGNPVGGVEVTFAAVNGGSISGPIQTTNAQGVATVGNWVIGTVAGTNYQLTATAPGLSGSPITFATTATAGSAGKVGIVLQPSSTATSGTPLAVQPQVRLLDASDNPVLQSGVAITATIASGPGGAITGQPTAITNESGIATFSSLAITGPSGAYTLAFAGQNLSGVESNVITLGAGAATRLALVTPPSATAQNGVEFATQPVIQLQDNAGNPVGTAGVQVNAVLQPGPGATLGGDVSITTNSGGTATFTDLRITGNLSPRTILFASTGLTSVSSGQITVSPGPVSASMSQLSRSPSVIAASSPGEGGSTITITARDGSGNAIPGAAVTLLSVSGVGSFSAIAPTDALGIATATYTSTVAGAKTIGAEIDGVTIAATVAVTVGAATATAANSSLSVSPGTITVNGAGATATVTARDAFGNLASGADVIVSITSGFASPSSGQTNSSGVFTSTVTSGEAGTQTVSASVEGGALPAETVEVTAIATTTSLVTSGSPSTAGESVTFTATVSATSTPGGIVSFYDGGSCAAPGTLLGSDALSGGVAAVATSSLAAGVHTIIACYPGNALFAPSSGSVAQTVDEPPNQAPTAADQAFGGTEDQPLLVAAPGVLAGAADADGTIAGAVVATGPAHGTLDLASDGSFTYTPEGDYSGSDAFTYRAVDDDGAQSSPAGVTLTVAGVNDAPSFSIGGPRSASSTDGPQAVPGWISAVSAGPGEESQAVAFEVSTDNDAAFASLPAVAPDGSLTFEAAVVAAPTDVSVTVVARDDGGTANGGVDASAPQVATFTIQP